MTKWQRTAIENPCRLGEETMHPMFAHRFADGTSLLLTVNSGYE